MLAKMVPLDEVGRYTLAINLGMVMFMIVTSIKDAYKPYYYDLLSTDAHPDKKIIRIFSVYVTAVGLLALFGSLFAGELIMLLMPARYHDRQSMWPRSYWVTSLWAIISTWGWRFFTIRKPNYCHCSRELGGVEHHA